MAVLRRPGYPWVAAIVGALTLLTADIVVRGGQGTIPAAALLVVVLMAAGARVMARWPLLLSGMALMDLLVPSDGRYTVGGGLPFKLEPYRVAVGFLIIVWLVALLIDPRVRARFTKFEAPLALILLATFGSEAANTGRVSAVSSFVVKGLWVFACFVLFLYLVVSVVRTRETIDRIVTTLVCSGCVVAVAALVQRQTGFNPFDHLHGALPILTFNSGVELTGLTRGGNLRALASAGHPIELSNTMAMLVPLAIYLAVKRRRAIWWAAALLLVFGDLATGSKTGIVGLVVELVVYLCLRPRQTLRCWPALIPIVVLMHVLIPGAIASIENGFFPKGGLIASQSATFQGRGGQIDGSRLSRWGPQIHGVFLKHNVFFGEGYGTRIVGRSSHDNAEVLDDQWLGTLLETGILGVVGWLWLFGRVIRRLGARAQLERGSGEGWLAVGIAASTLVFAVSMGFYDAFGFIQAVFLEYLLIALAAVILQLPPAVSGRDVALSG